MNEMANIVRLHLEQAVYNNASITRTLWPVKSLWYSGYHGTCHTYVHIHIKPLIYFFLPLLIETVDREETEWGRGNDSPSMWNVLHQVRVTYPSFQIQYDFILQTFPPLIWVYSSAVLCPEGLHWSSLVYLNLCGQCSSHCPKEAYT